MNDKFGRKLEVNDTVITFFNHSITTAEIRYIVKTGVYVHIKQCSFSPTYRPFNDVIKK